MTYYYGVVYMKFGKSKQKINPADTCTKDIQYIPMNKLPNNIIIYRGQQAKGRSKY